MLIVHASPVIGQILDEPALGNPKPEYCNGDRIKSANGFVYLS
ncbi:hypothetical protein [Microvirga sp. BSC39]|nr:hypothetical protein [Microvirga sp. BSC39]